MVPAYDPGTPVGGGPAAASPGALPVSTGPVRPAEPLAGSAHQDGAGNGASSARLDDGAYAAAVAARGADLDRIDPDRECLVPSPQLLVALDVDGTILETSGSISSRMLTAIGGLRAAGAQVVIATGRGLHAGLPVARFVGLTSGWMVCANGALTVRMDPGLPGGYEVVDQRTFDPAPAIDVLAAAVPDGIVAIEDLERGFLTSRPFPEGELIEPQTVVSMERLRSRPVSRVILRAPGMDVDRFGEVVAACGLHSVEYAIGWSAWLDVAPDGVTKASALASLAERLGTGSGRALAVGDGSNDVEMIRWAGCGVVMGSAAQEVRAAGDIVTGPVWQDGCAAVLDAVMERTRS